MSKKKIITTASAVALAAVLALGGTLAYYSDEADEGVSNTWVDQGNSVSISETDEDGNTTQSNTYSIIPGTTDTKDPVVTAEYTLDSYVFVTVDDTTGDYITWAIANGWTQLDGHSDVYYMLLKTVQYDETTWKDYTYTDSETELTYSYDSGTGTYTVANSDGKTLYTYKVETNSNGIDVYTASIPVIDENTVTYSSEITNDTFAGYGSTVSLDFMAYIIQASLDDGEDDNDGYGELEYSSEQLAYYAAVGGVTYSSSATYTYLSTDDDTTVATALASAISAASAEETTVIVLPEADDDTEDVTLSSFVSVASGKSIVIDLNGNTLTGGSSSRSVQVTGSAELTLVNGEIENDNGYGVMAFNSSTVTLVDVDVTASSYAVVADNSTIVADGATITSTGSAAVYTQSGNNTVTLTDCEIVATGDDNTTAIGIWDTGANNTITVEDCTITSAYFGVYHNGSTSPVTITLKDSTITDTAGVGVYISNSSASGRAKQELTIDNCTITGPTAVEFKHTNATITNSTLIATAEPSATEYGNGACSSGYSVACTTNSSTDYVTGDVVVTDCDLYNTSSGEQVTGYYFVYQVADGYSVTINGTTVSSYNSYN